MVFNVRSVFLLFLSSIATSPYLIKGAAHSSVQAPVHAVIGVKVTSSESRYGMQLAKSIFPPQIAVWMQTKLVPEDIATICDNIFSSAEVQNFIERMIGCGYEDEDAYSEAAYKLQHAGFTFFKEPTFAFHKTLIIGHKALPGYVIKLASKTTYSLERLGSVEKQGLLLNIGRVWSKDRIEDMIRVHHPEELAKSEQQRKNSFYCAQEAIYCAANPVAIPQLAIMVISKEEQVSSRSTIYEKGKTEKIKLTLQERGVPDVGLHNFIGTCLVDLEPHGHLLAEFIKDPFARYKVNPIFELTSSALHRELDEIRKKHAPKKHQEPKNNQAATAFINFKKYALGVGLATSLAVSMSPAVMRKCGMAGLIGAAAYGIKKIIDAL